MSGNSPKPKRKSFPKMPALGLINSKNPTSASNKNNKSITHLTNKCLITLNHCISDGSRVLLIHTILSMSESQ